jgi:hypothetical protein
MIGTMTATTGQNLKRTYRNIVKQGIERTSKTPKEIITEEDINHFPMLLRKYLRYAGVVGSQRVNNVKIVFKGRMRGNPDEPWMYFTSEQYNFFDHPTRAFYIKAKKMGLPVNGLHLYQDHKAYMKIKLAGLIKIIDVSGSKMDISETVTYLNDICFFAPAALIELDVNWEVLEANRLKATYNNGVHTISAVLVFDEDGKLVNFVSNDRYEIKGKSSIQRPWFTPVEQYGDFGKHTLPKKAEACYKRTNGDFCYGEFITVCVKYNCQ